MIRKVMAVFCTVILLLMIAGCKITNQPETAESIEPELQQEQIVIDDIQQSEEEQEPEESESNPDSVAVKTPYGNLYYQEQWLEYMKIEQVEESECLRVAFFSVINGMDYPLFCVYIGEADGALVGQLTDMEGTQRNVYVAMEENIEHAELSKSEQDRVYAMQEDINYIIDNLK